MWERAEAAAAAEPETEAITDSDSESEEAMDGTVGVTREEKSLGDIGSSVAEWSGAEDE